MTGSTLDAELTMAMATAWLDQEFGWAIGQPERTLDDAAMTGAEVISQAAAITQASEYNAELTAPVTGPLANLPPVISYEALAPAMYAPLLPAWAADATNPLGAPDTPVVPSFADDALEQASAATLARR